MRVNGNKNGKNKFEKNTSIQTRKEKKTHYHTLHLSDRIIIDERKKNEALRNLSFFGAPFPPLMKIIQTLLVNWNGNQNAMRCNARKEDKIDYWRPECQSTMTWHGP